MEMDSSSSPPVSSLRHRLRATVCCCFGGDRAQWGSRRAGGGGGGGEFRYDPLSYALNFDDQGPDDGEYEEASIDDFGDAHADGEFLVYRGFSSSSPARSTTRTPAAAVAEA